MRELWDLKHSAHLEEKDDANEQTGEERNCKREREEEEHSIRVSL